MKLVCSLALCLSFLCLTVPGICQKSGAKPQGRMVLVEHYECAKCHSTWGLQEAKDAKFISRCCKAKLAKERGASTPALECKRCNVKWGIVAGQSLKGKCPSCKGPLSPYSPPSHWECPNCLAQWAEREAVNVKRKCPACNKPLRMKAGPVDATFQCAHCKMKWSQRDADKLQMICPKCKMRMKIRQVAEE